MIHNLIFDENQNINCSYQNGRCASTIVIANSSNLLLDSLQIKHSKVMGIAVSSGENITLQNSVVENAQVFGVWTNNNPWQNQANIKNLHLTNNLFRNIHSNAILLSVSGTEQNQSTLIGNQFIHNHRDSLWDTCGGPCGGGQVLFENVDHLEMKDNVIKNGSNDFYSSAPTSGIELWFNVHNVKISNNDIYNNTGWGIISNYWDVVDIQNVNITDNRVYRNGYQNIKVPGANVNNNCYSADCPLAPTVTPVSTVTIPPKPIPLTSLTPTPGCPLTPPNNLSTQTTSLRSARLNWQPGTDGTKQLLRLAPDTQVGRSAVNNGCPDYPENSSCIIKKDDLPSSQNQLETSNVLNPNTTYYWSVVEYSSPACWRNATDTFTTCAATDLTCDSQTNLLDMLAWRRLWATQDNQADTNSDGQINIFDYLFLFREWLR